jgi:hypothetical protein
MLSSFGMGSGSDLTTAVSSARDYKFSQLSDEGFDQVETLREKPIVESIKKMKKEKSSKIKEVLDQKKSTSHQVYEGKVLSDKARNSRTLSSARRRARASKGIAFRLSKKILMTNV